MLLGNVHKAHDKTLLIMKHSDPLLRRAPVAPSQSRSHVQVRAVPRNAATNSRKAKEDSTSRIERTAETVEFVALALAAGGHALAAADRQRSINNTNLPTETRRAEPTSTAADILPRTSAIDSFWLSAPLLLAVAARSIATRLAKRRAEGTPAAQAMARLAAAETAVATQTEALTNLARQVDKLQIRTRIVGRDVKDQVKEAQAAVGAQGEVVLGATAKLQQLQEDVRAIEELVDAMQGLAAKQFSLLTAVIQQQKKAGQSNEKIPQKKENKVPVAPKMTPTVSRSQQEAAPGVGSQREPPKTQVNGDVGSQTDEWGRAVISRPASQQHEQVHNSSEKSSGAADKETTASSQVHLNEDGSVSYSF